MKNPIKNNIKLDECPECGEDHSKELENHDRDNNKEPEIGSIIRNIDDIRFISLYGEINEFQARRITQALIMFKEQRKLYFNKSDQNKNFEVIEPLEFLISSPGGMSIDMFSIYDIMKRVQKEGMEISTIGVGNVMSAAIPLLAAGTKSKRFAGKNCRFMIHSVGGGFQGNKHEILNEYQEMLETQRKYINILSKETLMTKKEIKDIINKNKNTYISAYQAKKLGIIDRIL